MVHVVGELLPVGVHDAGLKLPPAPPSLQDTAFVPPGADEVPEDVSVMVAV